MRQFLRAPLVPVLSAVTLAAFIAPPVPCSALAGTLQSQGNAPGGIIEGRVTGPNRRPMGSVRVDLLNDVYSPLSSSYTDGSGRFRFRVSAGVFYVDVEAQGQPFKRQRERVEINPISQRDVFRVDIELVAEKSESARVGVTGVHFYQKVPDEARAEYERGAKLLKDKPDEAYAALRHALQIFPDYYDAMELLGSEYVKASHLDHALPILLRAIEVNPKGDMSHYALGVGYYKLSRFADAAKEFSNALELNAKSVNAMLYLGLARLKAGQVSEAEPLLKKAYELGAKNVPDLHLALASIYIKTDRRGHAADQLELLLRESPDLRDRDKIRTLIGNLRTKAQ